jgi:hypothetical protein
MEGIILKLNINETRVCGLDSSGLGYGSVGENGNEIWVPKEQALSSTLRSATLTQVAETPNTFVY